MTTRPAQGGQTWTTRKLLAWMKEAFAKAGLDSPQLCAEMLVAHVLGCERLKLYMDPDRPAAPLERQQLRDLVARALKDEPVQYLVGEAWFFSMPFHVDRRVLIPRPATGTIVEHVLQHARATPGFGGESEGRFGEGVVIADICTGSGCVAVALAKHMPGARVVVTDVSPDALEVAGLNAARHKVAERVDLLAGDLLAPLDAHPATKGRGSLHYLVSNPPYIPDDEWESSDPETGVQANVKEYEPELALRGGPDGLAFVRPLLTEGPRSLRPGGLILVEVAASRANDARALAEASPMLEAVTVLKDFEGLPRTVVARRKA
ncbi:MAG TPA: peptide chain release factor N(5)-glutamine methyltransferase [Phycisphaerales bacterium]|nr:peptide chain release factor N(5)-glutamine methyltransferase [Phycisphaerales bacterium]